jgi:hypothetical protein
MILDDSEVRRPERKGLVQPVGWTRLHSWIFIIIVALGVLVIGLQNRYHYLSPLGLGKAYRIDRLFGGIQEYDAASGWVKAQLQQAPPPSMSMMPSPQMGPSYGPMMERPMPGVGEMPKEQPSVATGAKESAPVPATPEVVSRPKEETKEERLKAFQKQFPDFGPEEFQLANDDLFPHWKKQVAPNGTWTDFLGVYRDFIQWWNESGSPPEPGFKLWKDYLASKGR